MFALIAPLSCCHAARTSGRASSARMWLGSSPSGMSMKGTLGLLVLVHVEAELALVDVRVGGAAAAGGSNPVAGGVPGAGRAPPKAPAGGGRGRVAAGMVRRDPGPGGTR